MLAPSHHLPCSAHHNLFMPAEMDIILDRELTMEVLEPDCSKNFHTWRSCGIQFLATSTSTMLFPTGMPVEVLLVAVPPCGGASAASLDLFFPGDLPR